MGGKLSRDKGKRGEQQVVNILKDAGIPAKRISMMETGGIDKGDIEIAGVWKAEIKLGGMVPQWIYKARKEGEKYLICRKDRERWLVVMDLEDFINHL